METFSRWRDEVVRERVLPGVNASLGALRWSARDQQWAGSFFELTIALVPDDPVPSEGLLAYAHDVLSSVDLVERIAERARSTIEASALRLRELVFLDTLDGPSTLASFVDAGSDRSWTLVLTGWKSHGLRPA